MGSILAWLWLHNDDITTLMPVLQSSIICYWSVTDSSWKATGHVSQWAPDQCSSMSTDGTLQPFHSLKSVVLDTITTRWIQLLVNACWTLIRKSYPINICDVRTATCINTAFFQDMTATNINQRLADNFMFKKLCLTAIIIPSYYLILLLGHITL